MVSRIQNRNTGNSENLFSHNPRVENNTLNSIDGATAFKLDDTYLLKHEEEQNSSFGGVENNLEIKNLIFPQVLNKKPLKKYLVGFQLKMHLILKIII